MPGIVCAIRGGPGSRPTIETAIHLAKEQQIDLYFLYIVNLDFLSHTTSSRVHAISEDMQHMGEFILLSAQERASKQGVKAEGLIRHGNVGEEIIAACRSLQADYVILGRPHAATQTDTFDSERLEKFGARIRQETGAEVIYASEKGS